MRAIQVLLGCLVLISCGQQPETVSTELAKQPPKWSCPDGDVADGAVVEVKGSGHPIFKRPSRSASQLRNDKASAAIGVEIFHTIDATTRVQVRCVLADWAYVRIEHPSWLNNVYGWVERASLLEALPKGQPRVYEVSDLMWDERTAPFKEQLLAKINYLRAQDSRCSVWLDVGTLTTSPSRSTKDKPVFVVECHRKGYVTNVHFTLD